MADNTRYDNHEERQSADYAAEVENAWRLTMEHPCTCPPRPSTDECPRVEECYQAWCEATLLRHDDGGGPDDDTV